jgi:hypothetical protein
MTTHRYHRRDLNADFLRAGLGLAACITPMFFIAPGAAATYVLALPAAFFGLFGLRTRLHTRAVVTLDDDAIEITGWMSSRIAWNDLEALKLSYFSTRRDREAGWMQLTLRVVGQKIALNSSLEGFEDICRHAFHVTQTRDIELSDATARNLAAIGLGVDDLIQHTKKPAALSGWGNPADWRR